MIASELGRALGSCSRSSVIREPKTQYLVFGRLSSVKALCRLPITSFVSSGC